MVQYFEVRERDFFTNCYGNRGKRSGRELGPRKRGDYFQRAQHFVQRGLPIPVDICIFTDEAIDETLVQHAHMLLGMCAPETVTLQREMQETLRQEGTLDQLFEAINQPYKEATDGRVQFVRRRLICTEQDVFHPQSRAIVYDNYFNFQQEEGLILSIEPIPYIIKWFCGQWNASPTQGWYQGQGVAHVAMTEVLNEKKMRTTAHEIGHALLGLGHHVTEPQASECIMGKYVEDFSIPENSMIPQCFCSACRKKLEKLV